MSGNKLPWDKRDRRRWIDYWLQSKEPSPFAKKAVGSVAALVAVGTLLFTAIEALDDDRDPTIDSPVALEGSELFYPVPCHIQGVFHNSDGPFLGENSEEISSVDGEYFGKSRVSFRVTAEGESSYTIEDVSLVDVSEIPALEDVSYIDGAFDGCGSVGGATVIGDFNFDDDIYGPRFTTALVGEEPQETDYFPATTVTREGAIIVNLDITSCQVGREFSVLVKYSKAGEAGTTEAKFGPFRLYSADVARDLYVMKDGENSLVPGRWGIDNSICSNE